MALIIYNSIMLNIYKNIMYKDKTLVNPVLGHINCAALCSNYEQCIAAKRAVRSPHDECEELHLTCQKCYSSNTKQQFNEWVLKQFQETGKLIDYLRQQRSQIPDKMMKNSWAVFTKAENIIKFRQLQQQIKNVPPAQAK